MLLRDRRMCKEGSDGVNRSSHLKGTIFAYNQFCIM